MPTLKYNFRELLQLGEELKGFDSKKILAKALIKALLEAQGYIAEEHLSAPGRGLAGGKGAWVENPYDDRLRTLTGFLRAQFMAQKPTAKESGDTIKGSITVSSVKYLPYHEYGIVKRFGKPRAPLQTGLLKQAGKMQEIITDSYMASLKKAIKAK